MNVLQQSEYQYSNYLRELFPNKSWEVISNVIQIVQTETPNDSEEFQLENIINLLTENGDVSNSNSTNVDQNLNGDNFHNSTFELNGDSDDDLLDEAVGNSCILNQSEISVYFEQLLSIFPDACPTFVRNLCADKSKTFINLENLIDAMILDDYPKKEIDPRETFMQLQEMLPNADPLYLRDQANNLAYKHIIDLKNFVEDAIEKQDYPTMENYLKNQKKNEIMNQYTTQFNINQFLKQFPDPESYFVDSNRTHSLMVSDSDQKEEDEIYALQFLYANYLYLRKKDIDKIFKLNSKNLVKTCNRLDIMRKAMRTPRTREEEQCSSKNILLLQEIAFLKHKLPIRRILKQYNEKYRKAREEALCNGLMQTCACCFDNELIPEECYFCKKGCIFCKECVKAGAEVVIGDGKLDFPCLADCGAEFSIPTLQMVLNSVVFSRMAQRKQIEEIKEAKIDGLETCPFCDFATIPDPNDKIFRCLNEECKKESCRECKHISHIPLRCNEIEYEEDVRMRTYIENKMTEALLRKCYKCAKNFIKESGCNKMTCPCGATMCYVCGQAVSEYKHFGNGDDGRCPLWTKDLNKFHADAVIQGATEAKAQLGVDVNPTLLKKDPSKGLQEHYGELPQ